MRLEHLLSGDQTKRFIGNDRSWDLEQPWLVRYQFYLFVCIERKLQATSYELQALKSAKVSSQQPEASSLKLKAKKEGL